MSEVAPEGPPSPNAVEATPHPERSLAETFFNHTAKCLAVLDAEGTILRANDACVRWLGASGNLTGRRYADIFPGEPWHRVREEAIRTRKAVHFTSEPSRSPDPAPSPDPGEGMGKYWSCSLEPVLGSNGELQFLLFSARDVTYYLRQVNAALGEFDTFAYSISHDLRAPLRAIDNFSNILLEDHANSLDPEAQRLFRVVIKNAATMRALIDGLLAYARAGRRRLLLSQVDLQSLACEVVEELRPSAGDRALDIRIAASCHVRADAAALREVLVNLLSNAIKFTRDRARAEIEIASHETDAEVICCVSDNGVGYEPQYAHKLFGLFQRLHDAGEYAGVGIGLGVVRRLVEAHGGRVWAQGSPGEGATFSFSLPRQSPIANDPQYPTNVWNP